MPNYTSEELQEIREKYVSQWILDPDNVRRNEVLQYLRFCKEAHLGKARQRKETTWYAGGRRQQGVIGFQVMFSRAGHFLIGGTAEKGPSATVERHVTVETGTELCRKNGNFSL
ncbi:hypothetical protein V8G54_036919 [Vigna mungo]|uniref:Uncharacterized protein n=1 Tax=Vigna mungo TaxID=3915 RepID=A0AAQ3RH15_VIGMU